MGFSDFTSIREKTPVALNNWGEPRLVADTFENSENNRPVGGSGHRKSNTGSHPWEGCGTQKVQPQKKAEIGKIIVAADIDDTLLK